MLEAYIIKRFFRLFSTTLFILVGIIWLTRIVKFVDYITTKNMGIADFALLTLLLLPRLIEFLLPITTFIAAIFTLNSLINSRELFILKSSGFSRLLLIKPFAKAFLFIAALNYFLAFYFVPFSHQQIDRMKTDLANEFLTSSLEVGVFNQISKDLVVYIDSKDKTGLFQDVIIHQELNNQEKTVIFSKYAKVIKSGDKLLLGLNDGKRLIIDKDKGVINSLIFAKYLTDLDFFNEEERFFGNKLKVSDLYFHQLFVKDSIDKYEAKELISERQHRILWPLLGFMLGFYALTVLLAGEFNRNGHLLKNIVIIATAFLFLAIYFLLRELVLARNELVFVGYLYIMTVILACLQINRINRIRFLSNAKK